MRLATALLALLIALFGALPSAAAAAPDPKVVLIVGPAGEATDRYREQAEAAATVAERYTDDVVRLYSPEATWPAVKDALQGAAIVVYLGHGNGWPSRYRDSPFGATQNGFGLNPVAGGGDDAHQYFGEDRIAAEVELAPNAVVLLHHLCYASGNTEPGLPEGTLHDARQRVDNYAAGFIQAGAGAVVAEGHLGPAWYVKQLLSGSRSIERTWLASPNRRGHVQSWSSTRSDGYTAAIDPDREDSGFFRSIVYRDGVGGGRFGSPTTAGLPGPAEPTLIGTGLEISTPYLKAPPVAGTETQVWFPWTADDPAAVKGLTVGVRWDPLEVAGQPATDDPTATEPDDGSAGEAGADTETAPDAAPAEASTGRLTFIEPERLGDVVDPVKAIVGRTRIVAPVTTPSTPGRYRLVVTLHDAHGVAYDAPTQSLVGGAIVDVAGEVAARYLAPATLSGKAGEALDVPVAVANAGARAWGQTGDASLRSFEERPTAAVVLAHWVPLDVVDDAPAPAPTLLRLPPGLAAGATERVVLATTAPSARGAWLLVVDTVVPGEGSLTALGSAPALVRVTVE
jgi:hypothetical protein